jgi:hypothetical protein
MFAMIPFPVKEQVISIPMNYFCQQVPAAF